MPRTHDYLFFSGNLFKAGGALRACASAATLSSRTFSISSYSLANNRPCPLNGIEIDYKVSMLPFFALAWSVFSLSGSSDTEINNFFLCCQPVTCHHYVWRLRHNFLHTRRIACPAPPLLTHRSEEPQPELHLQGNSVSFVSTTSIQTNPNLSCKSDLQQQHSIFLYVCVALSLPYPPHTYLHPWP